MLKEVEVPQPLGLGIMNFVFAGGPRMTEAGATHEVNANRHLLLAVEVHLLDEPRVSDTKSSRKQVVDLVRHLLSTEFANPSEGGRTTAARVQRSQRVNRRSSACGFMDGGERTECEAFRGIAAHNSTGSTTATELHINEMQPSTTHSFFERGFQCLDCREVITVRAMGR
jgi:hypothetical protein